MDGPWIVKDHDERHSDPEFYLRPTFEEAVALCRELLLEIIEESGRPHWSAPVVQSEEEASAKGLRNYWLEDYRPEVPTYGVSHQPEGYMSITVWKAEDR